MKILIIRFSSMGDLVLTTPVIRALAEQLKAEVHVLTKASFASVLQHNPHVTRIWTLEEGMGLLLEKLRKESFDHIVDLHRNLRSLRVKLGLRRPSGSFRKLNLKKWLLVRWKKDLLPKISIVERYMEAASALGVKNDGRGLDFFVGPSDRERAEELTRELGGRPYVALVIGAAHATKQVPEAKLKEFLGRATIPAVVIGGPGESALGQRLSGPMTINTAGECSIGESAALLERSALVLTPDTGMMHIAAALKKPIISVWGNTVPEFGMYPYFGTDPVFEYRSEVRGLSCRPCSKIGFDKCPKGHFKCMNDQDVSDWVRHIREILN